MLAAGMRLVDMRRLLCSCASYSAPRRLCGRSHPNAAECAPHLASSRRHSCWSRGVPFRRPLQAQRERDGSRRASHRRRFPPSAEKFFAVFSMCYCIPSNLGRRRQTVLGARLHQRPRAQFYSHAPVAHSRLARSAESWIGNGALGLRAFLSAGQNDIPFTNERQSAPFGRRYEIDISRGRRRLGHGCR